MRAVAYSSIQAAVARRMGWDPENLNAAEFHSIRQAITQALGEAWYATWWRDLVRIERRKFRETYSATTAYIAGDEVWDPATDSYYQALTASTGQAPSLQDSGGTYQPNLTYWAKAVREPAGADYSATAVYAPGDVVRNPADAEFYQCRVATTGNAPTSTAYWGLLTGFRPVIQWTQAGLRRIGRVRRICRNDPRSAVGERRIGWNPSDDGLELFSLDVPRPWVEFVEPAPRFEGDYWADTVSYVAAPAEYTNVSAPATTGGSSLRPYTTVFATVADMINSDSVLWSEAECSNYAAGDGIMSIWIRTNDANRLPNGTDVLRTVLGLTVVRIYVRESDGGAVVPGGTLSTYTVTVPVMVPTVADLRASLFSADLVWVGDETNPMAFRKGTDNALDDGVNGVLNAAGVHYDRIRFT